MRSRADMIGLAIGVALLALGPLVLTLMRSEDYSSTATIVMSANRSGDLLGNPVTFVSGPLRVRDVQRSVERRVGWLDSWRDVPEFVTVRRLDGTGRPRFAVTARGPGADEVQALAGVTASRLAAAAENGARFYLEGRLARIERQLERGSGDSASRRELTRLAADVRVVVNGSERVFEASTTPATVPEERAADKLLGALPGERPLRPNPLWAAVAGIALALALLVWVLALSAPDRRRAPPAQG